MKELTLPELIRVLEAPEEQPIATLVYACKQAYRYIKNQEIVYREGAKFAALLLKISNVGYDVEAIDSKPFEISEEPNSPPPLASVEVTLTPAPANLEIVKPIPGGLNLYITGIRPVKGQPGGLNMVTAIKLLREASGELNAAPRMSLMNAKAILEDLTVGDRDVFIRTFKLLDEAQEFVKDFAALGIAAELRK